MTRCIASSQVLYFSWICTGWDVSFGKWHTSFSSFMQHTMFFSWHKDYDKRSTVPFFNEGMIVSQSNCAECNCTTRYLIIRLYCWPTFVASKWIPKEWIHEHKTAGVKRAYQQISTHKRLEVSKESEGALTRVIGKNVSVRTRIMSLG